MNDRHRSSVDFRAVALGLVVALLVPVVYSRDVLFVDTDHLLWDWLAILREMGLGPRFGHIPGLLCSGLFWVFCCTLFTGLCAREWILREKPSAGEIFGAVLLVPVSAWVFVSSIVFMMVLILAWKLRWLLLIFL